MHTQISYFQRLAVALLVANVVNGFQFGPGSCDSGVPVQGNHILYQQVGGGQLSDNGFEVRLNGDALQPGATRNVPVISEDYELTLATTIGGTFFRGFLIRIEGQDGVDTTEFLNVPDGAQDMVQVLPLCVNLEEVGGVGHTNNDQKTDITSLLRLAENAGNLTMDVTMVVQNRDDVSEWYNSRDFLNAIQDFGPTITTPTPDLGTDMPSTSPAPSGGPTVTSMPSSSFQPSNTPTSFAAENPTAPSDAEPPSLPPVSSSYASVGVPMLVASLIVAFTMWAM